jgi:hypothetical protein
MALTLQEAVMSHNERCPRESRKFGIRIGINENTDNIITDINGGTGVAGAGVNIAQRIMNAGNSGHIMVGHTTYTTLRYRDRYEHAFRHHSVTAKHGERLDVYQFIEPGHSGLNLATPPELVIDRAQRPLTTRVAFFIAHALAHEAVFKERMEGGGLSIDDGAVILLWTESDDSERQSENPLEKALRYTYEAGKATVGEQLDYYNSIDLGVKFDFARLIEKTLLRRYQDYFLVVGLSRYHFLVSEAGREALQKEFPKIFETVVSSGAGKTSNAPPPTRPVKRA